MNPGKRVGKFCQDCQLTQHRWDEANAHRNIRYRACIVAIDRAELHLGIRGFRIRHSREAPVASPAHVIYYVLAQPGVIEIARVLHDRMERQGHLGSID
ncbi:MAG: hypothetical protein AB7S92_06375 [Parvibaculaceae bacterium]